MKKFTVWESASVMNRYIVEAESKEQAEEMVKDAQVEPRESDLFDFEITEVIEHDMQ